MKQRRVVIGSGAGGETLILADDSAAPVTSALLPGVEIFRLWEMDEAILPVTAADHGDPKPVYYPPSLGVRFGVLTVPPGITYIPEAGVDLVAAGAELEAALPGAAAAFDSELPGVHTTDTVDFIAVVSGSGVLRHQDAEVHLTAGDCLVQNGMPHAWFNDGTGPFVIAFALCGARRTDQA